MDRILISPLQNQLLKVLLSDICDQILDNHPYGRA